MHAAQAEHLEIKLLLEIPGVLLRGLTAFLKEVVFFISGYFESCIMENEILVMQVTKMKIFNFLPSRFIDNYAGKVANQQSDNDLQDDFCKLTVLAHILYIM